MKIYIRIGVDLAKSFFQVHALPEEAAPALQRKLSRAKFLDFFRHIAPSKVGMEACATAHHWAQQGSRDMLMKRQAKRQQNPRRRSRFQPS